MRITYFLIIVSFLLMNGNLFSQDSLYFYSSGNIVYRIDKTEFDNLSLVDKSSQFQDSVYIMASGHVLFKEAMSEIDSLTFSNANINFVYQALAQDSRFSIFSEALLLTGLNERMKKIKDESYFYFYNDSVDYMVAPDYIPKERMYGYTILAESDSIYALNGIYSISDLINYAKNRYYNPNSSTPYDPDMSITDYNDSMNFFNQFVAYHLLDRKIAPDKFIDYYDQTGHQFQGDAKYDMEEYIETMRTNTIIEVRTDKANGRSNLINWDMDSDRGIKIISMETAIEAENGYCYEIDGILTYNELFYTNLSSKRMRIDFASMFSELVNNNLRHESSISHYPIILPPLYLDRIRFSDNTQCLYYPVDSRWEDFQGDELFIKGNIDVTIETMPIPSGNYEVRIFLEPAVYNPTMQIFIDDNAIDTVDFSIAATDSLIGYVVPGTDLSDPFGYENDKAMRDNGYIKAPACYHAPNNFFYKAENARLSSTSLRYIIGTFNFTEVGRHKLRLKAINLSQFSLDYMEFVPVSIIENEDIY